MSTSIKQQNGVSPLREVPPDVKMILGLPPRIPFFFKDETERVGGSKLRVARSLLDNAQRAGHIHAGTEVQLPSSGSTALAMAEETALRGLRLQVFLPASTPVAKIAAIEKYPNARVVKVHGSSEDAREAADAYVAEAIQEGLPVWLADQYCDPAAILAHALTTAPELLQQTGGQLTTLFAGVGTGSTTTGLAWTLRPLGIDVIGVQPAKSNHAITGLKYLPGVPEILIPKNAQTERLSAVEYVSDDDALEMTRLLIRSGYLYGPSTGAVVFAASRIVPKLRHSACVVLLAHDSAHYYPELLLEAQHA